MCELIWEAAVRDVLFIDGLSAQLLCVSPLSSWIVVMLSHRNLDFRFDGYKPFRLHSRSSRRDGRSQHIWDIKKTGGDMKKWTQDESKRETLLFSSGFDWFLLPSLNSCWSRYSTLGLLLVLIITLTHSFVWIWMFQTSWVKTVLIFLQLHSLLLSRRALLQLT